MTELSKESIDKVYEAIEVAKATGKIKKGTNETTKAIERGSAKFVAIAADVNPPEIIMHIPLLSKEKDVLCITVPSKEDLGASAGIDVATVSVAITQEGEAKKLIKALESEIGSPSVEDKPAAEEKPSEDKEEKSKDKEEPSEDKEEKSKDKEKPSEDKEEKSKDKDAKE